MRRRRRRPRCRRAASRASAGRATFAFGTDATRRVYFGAADTADTITNAVPIKLAYVSTGKVAYLGEGVAGKKLVQAGDVRVVRAGVVADVRFPCGRIEPAVVGSSW